MRTILSTGHLAVFKLINSKSRAMARHTQRKYEDKIACEKARKRERAPKSGSTPNRICENMRVAYHRRICHLGNPEWLPMRLLQRQGSCAGIWQQLPRGGEAPSFRHSHVTGPQNSEVACSDHGSRNPTRCHLQAGRRW